MKRQLIKSNKTESAYSILVYSYKDRIKIIVTARIYRKLESTMRAGVSVVYGVREELDVAVAHFGVVALQRVLRLLVVREVHVRLATRLPAWQTLQFHVRRQQRLEELRRIKLTKLLLLDINELHIINFRNISFVFNELLISFLSKHPNVDFSIYHYHNFSRKTSIWLFKTNCTDCTVLENNRIIIQIIST